MVQAAPQRIFISYSRTDSSFVDRLDADLRARDFDTWVDRQRLEGGQDWMDVIQNAIDGCEVLAVVLSPDAVQSQPVKTEYRYAIQTGKFVLPLQYRACERTPIDLRSIQWVDFEQDYEAGLKGLLIGLTSGERPEPGAVSAQTPIQAAPEDETLVAAGPVAAGPAAEINLRQLYASGAAARSRGELERAAIYWQQILDKDPNYLNWLVASEMNEIGPQLHPIRVRRLREREPRPCRKTSPPRYGTRCVRLDGSRRRRSIFHNRSRPNAFHTRCYIHREIGICLFSLARIGMHSVSGAGSNLWRPAGTVLSFR